MASANSDAIDADGHGSQRNQAPEQARCRIHIIEPNEPAPLVELDPESALIEAGALAAAALNVGGAPAQRRSRPGLIISPGLPAHAHGPVAGALAGIAIDAWLETRPGHADAVQWSHLRWHPVPGHEVSVVRAALTAAGDEPVFEIHAPPADMRGSVHAALPRETAGDRPAQSQDDPESATPRGEVEARIAAFWCDVLGVPSVGVSDNFFQLGGDSLIALQLQARLRNAFAVEVGVETLFERPTVAHLARWVCEQQAIAQATMPPRAEGADAAPAARAGNDAPEDVASLLEQLAQLSDAEAEALLAEVSSPGNGKSS